MSKEKINEAEQPAQEDLTMSVLPKFDTWGNAALQTFSLGYAGVNIAAETARIQKENDVVALSTILENNVAEQVANDGREDDFSAIKSRYEEKGRNNQNLGELLELEIQDRNDRSETKQEFSGVAKQVAEKASEKIADKGNLAASAVSRIDSELSAKTTKNLLNEQRSKTDLQIRNEEFAKNLKKPGLSFLDRARANFTEGRGRGGDQ